MGPEITTTPLATQGGRLFHPLRASRASPGGRDPVSLRRARWGHVTRRTRRDGRDATRRAPRGPEPRPRLTRSGSKRPPQHVSRDQIFTFHVLRTKITCHVTRSTCCAPRVTHHAPRCTGCAPRCTGPRLARGLPALRPRFARTSPAVCPQSCRGSLACYNEVCGDRSRNGTRAAPPRAARPCARRALRAIVREGGVEVSGKPRASQDVARLSAFNLHGFASQAWCKTRKAVLRPRARWFADTETIP